METGTEKKAKSLNYYSLDRILKERAHYNLIYGMRSNGKTFSVQELGLKNYIERGEQMAIIRRYDVDFAGKRGADCFTHFVKNTARGNIVEQMSNGKWTDIYYWSGRWYLCYYNEKSERIRDPQPFCYGFSLAGQEHDKSTSYPNITTILFDEFMTRGLYLPDEFTTFTNVLSTIIRDRDNVKIFMCGNTVNKYCPYFKEMGLTNILQMQQGDIQTYKFASLNGKTLRIAVEYAENPNKDGKPSDVYFAFNNPKLQMITSGVWELALYPHLPIKYTRDDVNGEYYIKWEDEMLHCEVITVEVNKKFTSFTYIHRKTTPVNNDNDLVFSTEFNPRLNYRRKITHPQDNIGQRILWYYKHDKIFYQDNDVGEIVRNYLNWCRSDKGFV